MFASPADESKGADRLAALDEEEPMTQDVRPFALGPRAGVTIQGPAGGPLTFKARGAQTGGALTVLENVVAPGDGPPLHAHAEEDEMWVVLEGALVFRLGGALRSAPEGSFVFVPRGTPHCFRNAGDRPARILVAFTPAGMEGFFERFAALPGDADVPRAFRSIGREVGMEVLGGPLGTDASPAR
jgi:quercetin dioxygenase-like cupin family protein